MDYAEGSRMRRSTSMPVKPRPLEVKELKRSEEKETVYKDIDYYPESPKLQRKFPHGTDEDPFTNNWTGSTIELDTDIRRMEMNDSPTSRKKSYRVIEKSGRENVIFRRIPEKSWRYIRDFVTTLIEIDWKYTLGIFVGSYTFSWFFFAGLCYMVAYSHGDLIFDEVTGERLGEGNEPCITGVYDFVSMLVYSIETQTTIGYGEKYPSEECPETIFLFIMQIICSICMEGMLISMIYAKTARPAQQMTKLKFSDKAVICYRNGRLCLMFRVCDPRKQQTIESKIRVYLIAERPTKEGEFIQTHSEIKIEGSGKQIIIWPEIICHVIDETSPLHHLKTARDFNTARFELYVSIVGTSEATAQVTEARTSYVPREDIFWGQRFVNIINYDAVNERYVVDYKNFNTTISVDMTND